MKLSKKGSVITLSALFFTACSTAPQTTPTGNKQTIEAQPEESVVSNIGSDNDGPSLPSGSNEMLRTPLTMADGLEVIISDVIIPPNEATPRHYHPGEEFVYILEGSVVHIEEGKPEFVLRAGDAVTLAPEVEHAPRATEEGARVIAFRVHTEGQPERILVDEEL